MNLRGNGDTLIVIGAGPKAVAIAAKWAALSDLGYRVPALVIIERSSVGAHWSGDGDWGYNDGSSLLGTSPVKDVGYPYYSRLWATASDRSAIYRKMLDYSWAAYLIDIGCGDDRSDLEPEEGQTFWEWFDCGAHVPTHRTWARYLDWVIKKVKPLGGFSIKFTSIADGGISIQGGKWLVACEDGTTTLGSGLVITGHGDQKHLKQIPQRDSPRILDGRTYWQESNLRRLHNMDDHFPSYRYLLEVIVIGLGGTAAGVTLDLLNVRPGNRLIDITMLARTGVMYSRGEGFHENRLHSDPSEKWPRMGDRHRRDYIERTDRGVFSVEALRTIDNARNVKIYAGDVRDIVPSDRGVEVWYDYNGVSKSKKAAFVINAIGFDPLWFIRLLDEDARSALAAAYGLQTLPASCKALVDDGRYDEVLNALQANVAADLTLAKMLPNLHVPMLSVIEQGPSFASLRALGLLSDRVLSTYVPANSREPSR